RLLHRFRRGGEVRIPDVVPVVRSVIFLAHSPRGTPHRANAHALFRVPGGTQANDADAHGVSATMTGVSFTKSSRRPASEMSKRVISSSRAKKFTSCVFI